jgi:hypothetical protein
MTQEEIIRMAREANIKQAIEAPHLLMVHELERFAALVAATCKSGLQVHDDTARSIKEAVAAELRRLHGVNAMMLEALEAASNYVDNSGGVSQRYRQVIAAARRNI